MVAIATQTLMEAIFFVYFYCCLAVWASLCDDKEQKKFRREVNIQHYD